MKKLSNVVIIIIIVTVGVGGFFGGYYYQKKKCASTTNAKNFDGNFREMSGTPPIDMPNKNGRGNGGPESGGNTGEIISKDDKSITIKSSDGSTKIIYYSDSTTISKNETVANSELTVGTNISAIGSTNTDKSVTAKNIIIQSNDTQ